MLSMDPNLSEMLLEGEPLDEVMAVLRLHDASRLPEGVRVIAQFGKIITCRLIRQDIPKIRAHPAVASMKAPDPVIPEVPPGDEAAGEALADIRPTDVRRPSGLRETGRGIVVGVIDWGCDFAYPSFRKPDGSTRLLALWNQQGASGAKPNRYGYGVIHDADDINRALKTRQPYAQLKYNPARSDPGSTGTHGTHVLDIAAGNGASGTPAGIAPEADIVFVHLSAKGGGFVGLGDSITLLEAVDFIFRTAGERPCVINMSLGNMAGPHDGTTLVEQGLDSALLAAPGRAISQSCGNYFGRGAHAARQIRPGQVTTYEWVTDEADRTPNEMEIWYSSRDQFSVRLRSPDGKASERVMLGGVATLEIDGRAAARIYNRPVDPNNLDNNISIFLYPKTPAGIWLVEVRGEDVVDGRMHAWIERDEGCPKCQSKFNPRQVVSHTTTGTIANGLRTITVGAYDAHAPLFQVAPFSSAGPTRDGRQKPDLCAPGVAVLAARSAPKPALAGTALLTRKSGTSMAAPHVAGCIALMFAASPRKLRIEETRRLLLVNTRIEGVDPALMMRVGSGVLDVRAAVEAARHPDALTHEQTSATPSTAAVALLPVGASGHTAPRPPARRPSKPDMETDQTTTAMINYDDDLRDEHEHESLDAYETDYQYASQLEDEDDAARGEHCCHACGQTLAHESHEQSAAPTPTVMGQVTVGTQQSALSRVNPLVLQAASFEGALRFIINDKLAAAHLINGHWLTDTTFDVSSLSPAATGTTFPPVIEVNAPNASALVFNNGEFCYFPADPVNRGTRWVQVPRLKDFYALAPPDQTARRDRWVERLNAKINNISVPNIKPDRAWLEGLSMPALRLLLAHYGAQMFTVASVAPTPKQPRFNGARATTGITRPNPKIPLEEPDCYLPVVSMVEGAMEDINAYDMGAGISIGSIQINAIEAKIFSFLDRLNTDDAYLFRQEFGTPLGWSMQPDKNHPDLLVNAGTANAVTLHGRGADTDRNVGYFQSGTPGNSSFAQIDANFRRRLTERFLRVVVWPHAQEMILVANLEYLRPGLNKIHQPANGIPPLNLNDPDRDTFILKAMLLSAYVRFSGCMEPILRGLRQWASIGDKLKNIINVINNGTFCTPGQRTSLAERLTRQETHARSVHDMLQRVPAIATRIALRRAVPPTAGRPLPTATPPPPAASRGANRREALNHTAEPLSERRCECTHEAVGSEHEDDVWRAESPDGDASEEWGESLVGYANEALGSVAEWSSPESLIEAMLERTGLAEDFRPDGHARSLSAAEIFDTFNSTAETPLTRHYSRFFEVVAHPRTLIEQDLQPGDLLIERALGEGNLAHVSVVARGETLTEETLAETDLIPAGNSRGLYVEVIENRRASRAPHEQFARRVARPDGRLRPGQMVVRLKHPVEAWGAEDEPAPSSSDAHAADAAASSPVSCTPGGSTFLHAQVVTAVNDIQTLSGETYKMADPPCAATTLCPGAFQSWHTSNEATHLVGLTKDKLRIAALAGLFGKDVSKLNNIGKKATADAKTFALVTPLQNVSFVAIRKTGKTDVREIHLHHDATGARSVQAEVDGRLWRCLPIDAHPGVIYTLMKLNWPRASLHRQWGKEASIAWIKALCNFYLDQTGLRLGVGDISHVCGEEMLDDHQSHQKGIDVDLYVLDYPAGSAFPEAYFCAGDKKLLLKTLTPPANNTKMYTKTGGATLTGAQETTVWNNYATVLAYCLLTWNSINAFVWHGVHKIDQQAVMIASNAYQKGWKSTWGADPGGFTMPADVWKKRGFKLIGQGSSSYGSDWPIHDDHIHIRLTF